MVGEELFILGRGAGGDVTLLRDEGRGIELEKVGRKALQAEHQVGPVWTIRPVVLSSTRLKVEPWRDRPAPERLDLGILELAPDRAFALGLDPELVDIAAIPALTIPQIPVSPVPSPVLEPVRSEEHTSELK